MKRLAISLSVCLALVGGWAGTGNARRGGGKAAAPAAGDENAGGEGGEKAAPAAGGEKEGGGTPSESLDTTETEPTKIEESLTEPKKQNPTATLSWQDILVVPRKAFLKGGRVELAPFTGVSINDNLIRHYVFGADLNYFLTDALWVGLQGQYFVKQLETQSELLGLQFNRTSTMNKYLYAGAFNMGYVPSYGKFALFNRQIVHWEIWISAGFGATFTEVLARDPAQQRNAFKNTALTPNAGLGGRLFLTDWLTVNVALRDYIIADKFEPVPAPGADHCMPADTCKQNADSALVNNFMVYAGVGMYLPTKFSYKTPR